MPYNKFNNKLDHESSMQALNILRRSIEKSTKVEQLISCVKYQLLLGKRLSNIYLPAIMVLSTAIEEKWPSV